MTNPKCEYRLLPIKDIKRISHQAVIVFIETGLSPQELAEQVKDLRNILVELEWSGMDRIDRCCPVCNGSPDHTSDCRLAAVLNKTKGGKE